MTRGPESEVRAPRYFPKPWFLSDRALPRRVVRPLERTLREEAGSASILLLAALAALVWRNVAGGSYTVFWETRVSVRVGGFIVEEPLVGVVNELLMAVFFYVIALEVKRELVFGALRTPRAAAVPVASAVGSMLGAAAVYLVVNVDGGAMAGWAIPIATDVAFALGALGLGGRWVSSEARVFLLTLAVVDDIVAIGVIGLFFTSGLSLVWLAAAGLVALSTVVANRAHVRSLAVYVVLAAVLWLAVFESGVHATIAGVMLALLTPASPLYPAKITREVVGEQLADVSSATERETEEATMIEASRITQEAASPLERRAHQLLPWSAYLILPIFALANAGVPVSIGRITDAYTSRVGIGIALGLLLGAPLGGWLLARALVRLNRADLPKDLDWSAIGAIVQLSGIGFTVAIFITVLALNEPQQQEQAKLAILTASACAALLGLTSLYFRHRLTTRQHTRVD